MHSHQYQNQSFLFVINSKEELQVYKKYYCTNVSPKTETVQHAGIGPVETGYLYHRLPLQLNIIKKFKYSEHNVFVDIGCGILRICNLVFYKG